MGRKPRAVIEASTIPADPPREPVAATTRARRRPRRRAVVETSNETATLIAAVLRSRGPKGATPDVLKSVITWALHIREEGEEIRAAQGRTRRKPLVPAEKLAHYEMNRALLDGVLAGTVTVKVLDDGQLLFVDGAVAEHAVFAVETITDEGEAGEIGSVGG